jgi:hypothetical protein
VKNAQQENLDGDLMGDACDHCRDVADAPLAVPPDGHRTTGGQVNDDLDAAGNLCDADFDGSGFTNVNDLLQFLDAFGRRITEESCPDEVGNPTEPCASYDLNLSGDVINTSDLLIVIGRLWGTPTSDYGCSPDDDGVIQCPLSCAAGPGASPCP